MYRIFTPLANFTCIKPFAILVEISGDYMNIYDSTGDVSYMEISEADGKTVLIAFDSAGKEAMIFKQVVSKPASKSKTGTSRKR